LADLSTLLSSKLFADVRLHTGAQGSSREEPILTSSLLLGAMKGAVSCMMEEETRGMDGFWDIIVPEAAFLDLKNAFLELTTWTMRRESKVILKELLLLKDGFIPEDELNIVKDEFMNDEQTMFADVTAELLDEDPNHAETKRERNHLNSIAGTEKNGIEYDILSKEFSCNVCEQLFPNQSQLRLHHRLSHSKLPVLRCELTGCQKAIFKSKRMLHKHLEKKHSHFCTDLCGLDKESSPVEQEVRKKKAKNHLHSTSSYFCEECGNRFSNSQNLKHHKEAVHENRSVPCPECGKIFKHANNLRIHRDQKHSNQSFLCNYCATEFSSRKNLRNHMHNIHQTNAEKKHQCSLCEKAFVEKGKLKAHMSSVHLKDTPYHCRYECGRAYNDASNRNAHEKRNHGSLHLSALVLLKERNTLDQTLTSKHYTSSESNNPSDVPM